MVVVWGASGSGGVYVLVISPMKFSALKPKSFEEDALSVIVIVVPLSVFSILSVLRVVVVPSVFLIWTLRLSVAGASVGFIMP